MLTILVTTDFSDNSKAGLFFAIQLASQTPCELTFFHTFHTLVPTAWNAARIDDYEKNDASNVDKKLHLFVENIYKELGIGLPKINCVAKSAVFPQSCIIEYATENNIDFICISTKGAGKIKRILGTNTANLINNSEVPVIAVPHNYNATPIVSVLYASDLFHYEKEILKVIAFAEPLYASIELLHLTTTIDKMKDVETIESAVKKIADYNINVNMRPRNIDESLVSDIEEGIKKINPSMMIMFTEQNRNWFEKIFLSSKSAEYSFDAKVPLLVFNKS
jgi:nucleotide-binding universal stress UspA family protein